jgi:hypothetical protein
MLGKEGPDLLHIEAKLLNDILIFKVARIVQHIRIQTFWPRGKADDVGDLGSRAGAPQVGVKTVRRHTLSEHNATL